MITVDFWSVVLIFGALQGYFLTLTLFLHKKGEKISNRLLAFLLLIFSLLLSEYVLIFTGLFQQAPGLLGVTAPLIFLVGPIYYFYALSLLRSPFRFDIKSAIHAVPAVFCYLILIPFYLEAPEAKSAFIEKVLSEGYVTLPLGQFLILAASTVQMLIYFYLTYTFLEAFEERFVREFSHSSILNIGWLKKVSLALTCYMVLFFIAYFQLFFLRSHRQEIFLIVMIAMAFFIQAVGYYAIRRPEIFSGEPPKTETPKYEKTALSPEKSRSCLKKLLQIMEAEKPYLDANLKLADLATSLNILPNYLSQVINTELNNNFFDFVNKYRVDEAKARMIDPKYAHLTLLAVALDVGFSNKASFNRVFKKHTHMTPSEFVRTHKIDSVA